VFGVAGDQAAEDDSAVEIHAVEDGLLISPQRFRNCMSTPLGVAAAAGLSNRDVCSDGDVEAEIVFNPLTIFHPVPAMPTTRPAAWILPSWPTILPVGQRRRRRRGFHGLRLHFEEAENRR